MCSKPSVSKVYTTTGSMEELVEYLRLLLEEILESFDVQMLESGPNSVISMAYLYILGSLLGLRKLLEGSMFNQRKLNDANKEEEANNLYDDDDLENDDESEKKSLFDDLEALLDSENFDDFIETFFNYSTYFFLPIIIYIFGIYILHGLGGFYSVYVDYFQKNPSHIDSYRAAIPAVFIFYLLLFIFTSLIFFFFNLYLIYLIWFVLI